MPNSVIWPPARRAPDNSSAHAIEKRTQRRAEADTDARASRMHRGYANLKQALVDAERASAAARALTARALGSVPPD
jgi:hypothetical protein